MSFFSALAKRFTGAFKKDNPVGGTEQMLSNILNKINFWIVVTIFFWILYLILFLFQCSKPIEGEGVCLLSENNSSAKTFTYNMANLSSGGECGAGSPYEISGQNVDWIDTGFVTNGKQLIIYVDGNYFPWGEKQTPKIFSYHVSSVKFDDGTTGDALNITTDYKECEMNTDVKYSLTDDQITKIIYENQFNSYTSANANNRNENSGKKLIDSNIQGDCIIGNNCAIGTTNEIQKACVLKNGAGIYMKIGDSTSSYHIKNYFVPAIKKSCISEKNCQYQYETSNNGTMINLVKVPFAIPPVIYKKGINDKVFIFDIRDNIMKNLQILTDYDKETEYKFYVLVPTQDVNCVGDDYQKINGICYHSEQKKLLPEDMQNVSCPVSSNETINLPNELCAPQSGKKIYIKPSDTCYEDNTGIINLTFTSGAKSLKEGNFSYKNNGLHITWVQSVISTLFEPFFGNQSEDDRLSVMMTDSDIKICRDNDEKNDPIYFSNNNGDWIVKTEKYSLQGLKIKDIYNLPTTETLDVKYLSSIVDKCVVMTIKKDFEASKKISDFKTEEVKNATVTLFKITNLEDGLFVKIRNSIMSTSVYHTIRAIVVVWFVFSFGLGIVNKEKMLSRVPVITSDWKRFLILLWCTNPKNYDFIDKFLWNGLIYGAQAISAGIIDAISEIYGSSIETDESPMTFFDDVIASITSKEVFYKLGAVATSGISLIMFLFLFPFLANGIIDFILAVLGPIVSLGFTMFSFGSIIMFMPLYALISMFGGKEKDKFYIAMKKLVKEFIHFAFSVGFFGLFIGFIYHYFTEIMNVKVCWMPRKLPIDDFFGLFRNLSDWQICKDGSNVEADTADRFKIIWNMLMATFKFTVVLSIVGKLSIVISEQLANLFSQGGGSLSIQAASGIYNSIKDVVTTSFDKIYTSLGSENNKKYANKMQKKQNEERETTREGVESDINDNEAQKDTGGNNKHKLKQVDDINKNINKQNTNNDIDRKVDDIDLNGINDKIIQNEPKNNNPISVNENINIPKKTGLNAGLENGLNNNADVRSNSSNAREDSINNFAIKENNAGLKENDAGLKENDAGLKENDALIHDALSLQQNKQDQSAQEQLNKNEQSEKKLEKQIKKLGVQGEKLNEFGNSLGSQQDNDKEKDMAAKMVKTIEQKQRDASNKLKTLKKNDWELKKKNK